MIFIQSIGYCIIIPVYCGVHLLISPTALGDPSRLRKSVRLRDDLTLSLSTLPRSVTGGYIFPAIMMSLPFSSPKIHQYLVAAWQVFPIWIVILQYIFGKVTWLFPRPRKMRSKAGDLYAANCESLNRSYRFAFALANLTHCVALGSITVVQWFPCLLPASNNGHTVTFKGVFLPPNA